MDRYDGAMSLYPKRHRIVLRGMIRLAVYGLVARLLQSWFDDLLKLLPLEAARPLHAVEDLLEERLGGGLVDRRVVIIKPSTKRHNGEASVLWFVS